ncbi:MAG TPA: riboflavin synthase [Bacteroidia bacterium]|nr:riboflavin synthase [Bacteroidia bacterium]QQR95952.1 MAG: riboflavin synthase [Bacteroidota bacterium]MBP7715504.1 riboflavin synthase [Bacteroidia bacterium]MBP8667614.1 riboflavin synthase [Bacteroidia bacterium]HOZ82906.1 riboflavin synthase [Bacteroidia bacterium]
MFTGIIETLGIVKKIENEGSNRHFTVSCSFADELKIDQSVAHNGVCLTVVNINHENKTYKVTAVDETLRKTNLSSLVEGNEVNLERGMLLNTRLDGHIVQGHVDGTAVCTSITDENGSWKFIFENDGSARNLIVEKGSVTVNGVSLTVVDAGDYMFSVAIIPFTMQHTTFKNLKRGQTVNVEFDIIGKYVARLTEKSV